MIDPAKVCLFQPDDLSRMKADLFKRIGQKVVDKGGRTLVGNFDQLRTLPSDVIPAIGCSWYLKPIVDEWRAKKRIFIYWDRGYFFRTHATWLPRGDSGGMYRWHVNSFQLQKIRDVPPDRLNSHRPPVRDWQKNGKHVVLAKPSSTYAKFHGIEGWLDKTVYELSLITNRQLVVRDKETKRDLTDDLAGAHALVTHGSNTAVESAILGCPVFVNSDSAASLVGKTDLREIEKPSYPDREPWLKSLSYSQFSESELVDGTLWRLIE